MRIAIRLVMLVAGLLWTQFVTAQAPAGSTGQCKDGTYTTSASKQGACKGHQGIKEWYAAGSSAPADAKAGGTVGKSATSSSSSSATSSSSKPGAASSSTSTAAPAPAKSAKTSTANMAAAPGGGPGVVWLNADSNIYHCPGSQFYGKTKNGAYMSEADAKAKGAHPDHNRPCTK
jgi:Protein of unknown function (DUF3761)